MNLVEQIAVTIERYGLLPEGREGPVIVALSGGADSVALLAALAELGYPLVAAHCNFHLRGAESDRDMAHCVAVTDQLEINLRIRHFDVLARMKATGESMEMACRALRYGWFHDLLDNLRARVIAVAHHRQDSVETFMLNLLRTTGLRGLGGIPIQSGYVIRPMLECSRQQAEEYLQAKGIGWVVDHTNLENDFRRNRIRNVILPLIEQHFEQAQDAILATATHLRSDMELLDDLVAQKLVHYSQPGPEFSLDLQALTANEPQAQALLYRMLEPQGFNASQVADIIRSADASGLVFVSRTGTKAYIDRGALTLNTSKPAVGEPEAYPVDLRRHILQPLSIDVSLHDIADFHPTRNPDILYLDATILDAPLTLRLRHWHQGDRIRPYGLKGTRLLSDIFTDAKIPLPQKDKVWVLEALPAEGEPQILWVVGLRPSAWYPITPSTRRYLQLHHRPSR